MNVPIIRLEVERMKETIMMALADHSARIDADVQAAVDAYCTEGNVSAVVCEEVRRQLDAAVKEEIRNFFQWSKPGRQAVKEAVYQHLAEWDKMRTMDEP